MERKRCLGKHITLFMCSCQKRYTMPLSPNRASVLLYRVSVSSKQRLTFTKKYICLHQTEPLFEPNRTSAYVWCCYLLVFLMWLFLNPALDTAPANAPSSAPAPIHITKHCTLHTTHLYVYTSLCKFVTLHFQSLPELNSKFIWQNVPWYIAYSD